MKTKSVFTRLLLAGGLLLTWLPLLAPLMLGLVSLVMERVFRLDYLMPAELFFIGLAGGLLLIWAAARLGRYLKAVAGSLAAAVLMLLAAMVLASVTGLADGTVQPGGWQSAITTLGLGLYCLALAVCGILGAMLARDALKPVSSSAAGPGHAQ